MANAGLKQRVWMPVAGVATAATAVLAGWMPLAHAATTTDAPDPGHRLPAPDAPDGTFESCAAYFGFGKSGAESADVVAFDVTDQNGDDGVAHGVPADTQVVFILTNEEGDTLECTPPEITEEEWAAGLDTFQAESEVHPTPAWPGPGHYAYPSISYIPYIDDFGVVVDVAFTVTSVPDGHTLVSPTGVQPLVQHYTIGYDYLSTEQDPRLLDYVADEADQAAADAYADALQACEDDFDAPPTVDGDLYDALDVLYSYMGWEIDDEETINCYDVAEVNPQVAFLLGFAATTTYVEPIALALPETASSSTTTSTTVPASTEAPAATAVAATPTYTG
jgi:hypothetical protein